MKFHPLPRTVVHSDPVMGVYSDPVGVEIPIPNGFVCRYLALPHTITPFVLVHVREGDHGFPGALFEANPLGTAPELRGGYIGENVGPMTLLLRFSNRGGASVMVAGAVTLEEVDALPRPENLVRIVQLARDLAERYDASFSGGPGPGLSPAQWSELRDLLVDVERT
jgi:hypothetical protein